MTDKEINLPRTPADIRLDHEQWRQMIRSSLAAHNDRMTLAALEGVMIGIDIPNLLTTIGQLTARLVLLERVAREASHSPYLNWMGNELLLEFLTDAEMLTPGAVAPAPANGLQCMDCGATGPGSRFYPILAISRPTNARFPGNQLCLDCEKKRRVMFGGSLIIGDDPRVSPNS